MNWLEVDTAACSIARTLDVIGEKWTLLVLREAFNGVRRFDDIQRHLGVPRPVLSNRLQTLVDQGLLRRVPYREQGQRARHEYRLTGTGLDLYPALVALMQWGDQHAADPVGPPVRLGHERCGRPVHAAVVCECGEVVSAREVTVEPGPGLQGRLPA